jgi:chromosome segregation protein
MGFKSFCEKTHITFSGSGITCIVGPNGCGKSNIVDAISWVLGEQSHKLLRAERMSDCIFNGTVKRPPMGISEVQLTLVDAELAEAAAKVLQGAPASAEPTLDPENPFLTAPPEASDDATNEAETAGELVTANGELGEMPSEASRDAQAAPDARPSAKKRGAPKHAISMRPGEVVVGRRLYRSGQSEYLLNGRSVRLRDITELFMTMGLGPDSYAIIEQGRIGLILNSKPMDRRAIIEEAAGITMYKAKRRLAETKLEASKLNLSRVNDILVEVEKQLASLKRQASKARRYAELREEMRTMLRKVLAGKARQLDSEAERLEILIRDLAAQEETGARSLHEREAEQERLSARVYELDAELRQANQLLGQAALELDRADRLPAGTKRPDRLPLAAPAIRNGERRKSEIRSRRAHPEPPRIRPNPARASRGSGNRFARNRRTRRRRRQRAVRTRRARRQPAPHRSAPGRRRRPQPRRVPASGGSRGARHIRGIPPQPSAARIGSRGFRPLRARHHRRSPPSRNRGTRPAIGPGGSGSPGAPRGFEAPESGRPAAP